MLVFQYLNAGGETEGIQLRRNEKKLLNDVNNDKDGRLRFHILDEKGKKKKRIQTREEKIFILTNDCLTGDPLIHDLSLSQVYFLIKLVAFKSHCAQKKSLQLVFLHRT